MRKKKRNKWNYFLAWMAKVKEKSWDLRKIHVMNINTHYFFVNYFCYFINTHHEEEVEY